MKNYFRRIIQLFTSAPQDEETVQKVHQWLIDPEHAEKKEEALHELWLETDGAQYKDIRNSLISAYNKAGVVSKVDKPRYIINIMRYAAVVALLIVVASATYFMTKAEFSKVAMIENYTRAGKLQNIELPDGTKVQVNAGTLLLYPEKFVGDTRTVFLIGEANFKVKKNPEQPFIVRSNTVSVTALGTEFNVSAYSENDEIVATLLEGKVKVVCGVDGNDYILKPGQQVSYKKNNGKSRLSEANVDDVTAWQKGILIFNGMTIKEMTSILQRKYNVHFQCNPDLFNDDKYNFRFSEKATLQEVLKIMKEVVVGFEYRIDGNTCYIK